MKKAKLEVQRCKARVEIAESHVREFDTPLRQYFLFVEKQNLQEKERALAMKKEEIIKQLENIIWKANDLENYISYIYDSCRNSESGCSNLRACLSTASYDAMMLMNQLEKLTRAVEK